MGYRQGKNRRCCTNDGVYFPAYDPNGNVMGLVKASDGTVCAQYEYLPYGEQVIATGTMAGSNPIRFSTKYYDTEARLYYYGYRYYSSDMGRWLSRDPIEEQGGLNLYGFVNNDPVNSVDSDGRSIWDLQMFAKWLFVPYNKEDRVYLSWDEFDWNSFARDSLRNGWKHENESVFTEECKRAKLGNTYISHDKWKNVSGDFRNEKNVWISQWHGTAMVSPLEKGVLLGKDCKKCVFSFHLQLYAKDVGDFNKGGEFGSPLFGFLTKDDTWIWVRDHTPFGHDFVMYSFTDEFGERIVPYEN